MGSRGVRLGVRWAVGWASEAVVPALGGRSFSPLLARLGNKKLFEPVPWRQGRCWLAFQCLRSAALDA